MVGRAFGWMDAYTTCMPCTCVFVCVCGILIAFSFVSPLLQLGSAVLFLDCVSLKIMCTLPSSCSSLAAGQVEGTVKCI